jgi:putative transposase
MIFDFIQKHSSLFPVQKMAHVFSVSRTGYYKYINRKESDRRKQNGQLLEKIRFIYKQNRRAYGSPRIHAALKKQGAFCSRKRVAKLMKENNIRSTMSKKWRSRSNKLAHLAKVSPNLINQNFYAPMPNQVWVSDITYIWTSQGWLYVAVIMDLFSRKIVGLAMSQSANTDLIKDALKQAICHRKPSPGLIIHSDRGTQYTSQEYKIFAEQNNIQLSMSAQGNCYDNAAMESFFHTLKTEHVHLCNYQTRAEASMSIFEYIEVFYNRKRLHSTLNYSTPVEFESFHA